MERQTAGKSSLFFVSARWRRLPPTLWNAGSGTEKAPQTLRGFVFSKRTRRTSSVHQLTAARNGARRAVACICGTGSSFLKADVNAFDSDHIVRALKSSMVGSKYS